MSQLCLNFLIKTSTKTKLLIFKIPIRAFLPEQVIYNSFWILFLILTSGHSR